MRGIFGWVFLFLLLAGGSWARVWDVAADGTGIAPNIQAAIDSCATGDTVIVAPGTYTGAGNRDIDFTGKAIVVMSLSGPDVTIVDCGGSVGEYHRGFYFHSGEDTTSVLQGFTIKKGYTGEDGGAICCVGSSPKILDNVITGNYAHSDGGGVYCEGTHSIISGNTISHNEVPVWVATARDAGIARFLESARYETSRSYPPDPRASGGGGICCIADSSLVESNAMSGCKATFGSAIYCDESFVRVKHNSITENGGVYTAGTACFLSGSYDIEGNTIASNIGWNGGGGLLCYWGEFRIVGNTISGNRGHGQGSGLGGGLYCGSGNYVIENNDIIGNWSNGAGGLHFEGSGSISNNRISGNETFCAGPCSGLAAAPYYSSAYDVGGGLSIAGSTALVVVGNIITGNSAPFGAGVSCVDASIEITGNLIYGNHAVHNPCGYEDQQGGMGGGIYCRNSSPTITGNTIYSNGAHNFSTDYAAGAGIFCTSGSSPDIRRNIIMNNDVDNDGNAGGVFCEDSASVPSIACNDAYGNANADYGGTLVDQTGLNGNFSLDPIFCDAEHGDFGLHILSPCVAGHHPGGGDCGLTERVNENETLLLPI